MKTLLRVFKYLRRYPGLASLQLACTIAMTLALVIFPEITKHITNVIVPTGNYEGLWIWVLLALGGFFIRDICNMCRILVNNTFEQKVIMDLRCDLHEKIQRLPLEWFDARRTGDVMSRIMEDVQAMERVLIDGIEQGLSAIVQVIVIATVLFFMNTEVAFWATLPLPLLLTSSFLYSRLNPQRFKAEREAIGELNAMLHDNIAGIRQVKAYAAEAAEHQVFRQLCIHVREATMRIMRYWAMYNPSMSFVGAMGFVLVLGFGGYAVMQGNLDNGQWLQFFLMMGFLYEPLTRLHQLNHMLLGGRAAAVRVFEVLDAEEETRPDLGNDLLEPIRGEVIFDDVSFAYMEDRPIIRNFSLHVQPGKIVAFVGATGAGKSTLLSLLTRFYECNSGKILLDGQDISGISKQNLRSKLGYVTQDTFLFNGTVRENLLLGNKQANDTQIWEALEAAHAVTFVQHLPEQLDSNIGERGIKLSGGEKQRLSIARALLKNPPLLLLDEATASVDTQTEIHIQAALDTLMQGRTSFVIAHRLSTVANADIICVLEKGEIIEQGTHVELLKLNGSYAKLHQKTEIER